MKGKTIGKKLIMRCLTGLLILTLILSTAPVAFATTPAIVGLRVPDLTIPQYTHGYETTYVTEDGEYTFYRYDDLLEEAVLVFSDGSEQPVDTWELSYSDGQYQEPWGLGEHPVTVWYDPIEDISTTFTVTITDESDVDFIEGENCFNIIEFTSGEERGEDENTYYYYSGLINDRLTIHMKNGDTIRTYSNGSFEYENNYYSPYVLTDQSAENPWGVGEHHADLYFLGYHYPITVNIVESPVERIEADPVELIEHSSGYEDTDYIYDPDIDDYVEYTYFRYSDFSPNYRIYLKDGDVIEDNSRYVYIDGEEYYVELYNDQSYNNQWTVNHTYPCTLSVAGKTGDFEVSIIESPVKSLDLTVTEDYYEGTGGYLSEDYEGNSYYYYSDYRYSMTGSVTFKDGTVTEVDGETSIYYHDQYYYFKFHDNQSSETPWGVGTHEVEVELLSARTTVSVNILSSPVKSINIQPVSLYEGTGGYYSSYYDSDEEYYRYRYDDLNGTITMKDGTVITLENTSYFEYNGREYYIQTSDDQSFDNPWGVGTHKAEINVLGFRSTLDVSILPSPVKSITIKDVTLQEYFDAEYLSYAEYYHYNYSPVVEITFKNGTKATLQENSTYNYSCDYEGTRYYVNFADDQSEENPWGVGTHKVKAYFMGKLCEFTVTVTETPVKSVKILSVKPVDESYNYDENSLSFTYQINYKDGTSETKAHFKPSDEGHSSGDDYLMITLIDPESWHIGKGNKFKIFYAGAEATAYAEVVAPSAWEYIEQNGEIILKKYKGALEDLLPLPDEIGGKPVVGIAADAFPQDIKRLNLPESVRFITGTLNYPNLTNIYFGESFKSINIEMFRYLPKLDRIGVSPENPNYSCDGVAVFNKDETVIVAAPPAYPYLYHVPDTVKDIEVLKSDILKNFKYYVGSDSENFTVVDGVTYTKDMKTVVRCDEEKKGAYVMPSSVETISPYAFQFCNNLTSVKFSDSVTDIAYYSFYGCTSLTGVTLPKNLKTISQSSFFNCQKLDGVTLPASLESIGKNAFTFNYSLQSITIGNSVTEIGDSAFRKCYSLTLADMGTGVKKIGYGAFSGCSKLDNLTLRSNGVEVGDSAFYMCPLKNFTAWDKIKGDIEESAFRGGKFSSVSFSNTVTSIQYCSFAGNKELSSIKIPSSVLKVDTHAFDGTKWDDNLSDGANYIDGVFVKCKGDVSNLKLKSGTLTIADEAMKNRSTLTSVTLPDGIKRIGDHSLVSTSISTLNIPASVEQIGDGAFVNCTNLSSINVNASNKYFKSVDGVLYNKDMTELIFCPKRQNDTFELPESVKRIHPFAFGVSNISKLIVKNNNVVFDNYSVGFDATCSFIRWSSYYVKILYKPLTIVCSTGSTAERYAKDNLLDAETGEAPQPQVMIGDIDGDGVISVLDATRVQKYKAKMVNIDGSKFDDTPLTEEQLLASDVDGDGVVSVLDATRIQKYLARMVNLDGTPYTR